MHDLTRKVIIYRGKRPSQPWGSEHEEDGAWGWGVSKHVCVMLVAQSCLALCDPTDCSPPGSSIEMKIEEEWAAVIEIATTLFNRINNPCLKSREGSLDIWSQSRERQMHQFPHLKEWGLKAAWVGFLRTLSAPRLRQWKPKAITEQGKREWVKGREREIPRAAIVREGFLKEGGLSWTLKAEQHPAQG